MLEGTYMRDQLDKESAFSQIQLDNISSTNQPSKDQQIQIQKTCTRSYFQQLFFFFFLAICSRIHLRICGEQCKYLPKDKVEKACFIHLAKFCYTYCSIYPKKYTQKLNHSACSFALSMRQTYLHPHVTLA